MIRNIFITLILFLSQICEAQDSRPTWRLSADVSAFLLSPANLIGDNSDVAFLGNETMFIPGFSLSKPASKVESWHMFSIGLGLRYQLEKEKIQLLGTDMMPIEGRFKEEERINVDMVLRVQYSLEYWKNKNRYSWVYGYEIGAGTMQSHYSIDPLNPLEAYEGQILERDSGYGFLLNSGMLLGLAYKVKDCFYIKLKTSIGLQYQYTAIGFERRVITVSGNSSIFQSDFQNSNNRNSIYPYMAPGLSLVFSVSGPSANQKSTFGENN
jgi:hypothetical protein